jgi:GntR family transcriptional regulator
MVTAGTLAPGQRLGGERDLAADLKVSRSTLRQALGALEREGIVHRVPGRGGGTFVSRRKVERDLSHIAGVPALLREQGFTAGTRVISGAVVAADSLTAKMLGIKPGDFVVDLVRIRLADGTPISFEHARFPAARFPGLLELPLGGSVYELLETHYGTRPDEAVERIEVVLASDDESSVLGVEPGAPLLSVTRTTMDTAGERIEFAQDLFRADRTRIIARTPGRGTTADIVDARGSAVEPRAVSGG